MIRKIRSTWHLYRRVPKDYAQVERRAFVRQSLKTDSETEAKEKARAVWDELVEGWEAALEGGDTLAAYHYAQARKIARRKGFRYVRADQLGDLDTQEIRERFLAAESDVGAVDGVLGLAPAAAPILVSEALEQFWDLAADEQRGMDDDQLRKWRNPRKLAVGNFIQAVGDLPLDKITRDDVLEFKDSYFERLGLDKSDGGLTAATANKMMGHLRRILNFVNTERDLGLSLPLHGLRFKEGRQERRQPFTDDHIRDVLLAPGALDGLNAEARNAFLMVVNTGARQSEIANLKVHHLDLAGPIPLLSIVPEDRLLKNDHSQRKLPLTGVSLEAARAALRGAIGQGSEYLFPRYAGTSNLSAALGKYLRDNDLLPPNTTAYSLRRSLADRLIAAGVQDRVRQDIFGHAQQEIRYCGGGGDEVRHRALQAIAF